MRLGCLSLLLASCLGAQVRFVPQTVTLTHASSGALLDGSTLYSWGDGLSRLNLPSGRAQFLRKEKFGSAGCAADIDSDGVQDLVLHALPGRLVWVKGPDFKTMRTIDIGANFADCLAATVLGHHGILITHRGMQVRFYEVPDWRYREIYSFYTASYQAGLLLHDVDGDGRPDLLSGNYWIRSPDSFELPWRLFAINTYNDTEQAAHLRLALASTLDGKTGLVVSQGEIHPAKLALFVPSTDPKQLWVETRLEGGLDLNEPAGLAAGDVDGDGLADFILAERGGAKPRVWWWRRRRDGGFQRTVIYEGSATHSAFLKDLNGDGHLDVVLTGPTGSLWLKNVPVK